MPTVLVNGIDVSGSYTPDELDSISIAAEAFDAEVGQGSVPVPDPAGSHDPYAGQALKISDGAVTLIDGFLGPMTRDRGPYASAPGRLNRYTLADDNALLFGRRTAATGWARPAETDRDRILAFAATFAPSLDTTWVLATNTVNVAKKTYRTDRLVDELLEDLVPRTAKTLFVEGRRLHWHRLTEGEAAGLTIHDTAYDHVTAFPPIAARPPARGKDPQDLRNDVLVRNPAGATASSSDATSIGRHDAGGVKHQALVEHPDAAAGDLAAIASAQVLEQKDERITYECTIGPLTPAKVDLIRPGARITCTVQVWGLSGSVQRVAQRTLRYRHPGKWFADLQLGHPRRVRQKAPQHLTSGQRAQVVERTGPAAITTSTLGFVYSQRSIATCWNRQREDSVDVAGSPFGGNAGEVEQYWIDRDNAFAWAIREVRNYYSWDLLDPALVLDAANKIPVRARLGSLVLHGGHGADLAQQGVETPFDIMAGAWGTASPAFDPGTLLLSGRTPASAPSPAPIQTLAVAEFDIPVTAGRYAQFYIRQLPRDPGDDGTGSVIRFTDSALMILTVDYISGASTALTGQTIGPVQVGGAVDGSNTAFSTHTPYAAGSLRVFVDGIEQTQAATETNPATGAFTLSFAPRLGERVTAIWRVGPA